MSDGGKGDAEMNSKAPGQGLPDVLLSRPEADLVHARRLTDDEIRGALERAENERRAAESSSASPTVTARILYR